MQQNSYYLYVSTILKNINSTNSTHIFINNTDLHIFNRRNGTAKEIIYKF